MNLARRFRPFDRARGPKIVRAISDFYIKLARVKGEFVLQAYEKEDELFLIAKGRLTIKTRGRDDLEKGGVRKSSLKVSNTNRCQQGDTSRAPREEGCDQHGRSSK